jgi:hypothetical protein
MHTDGNLVPETCCLETEIANEKLKRYTRVYPKVSELSHNEINNKHSLRSNTKCYEGKTH